MMNEEIMKAIDENHFKVIVILSGVLVIAVTLFSFGFYRDVETPSIYVEVEPEPEITPPEKDINVVDVDDIASFIGLAIVIAIAKGMMDKW